MKTGWVLPLGTIEQTIHTLIRHADRKWIANHSQEEFEFELLREITYLGRFQDQIDEVAAYISAHGVELRKRAL